MMSYVSAQLFTLPHIIVIWNTNVDYLIIESISFIALANIMYYAWVTEARREAL